MLTKCNCQHIFKCFEKDFWSKMAFKVHILESKQTKRILKRIFGAHRVIVQKILWIEKDRAPLNYAGRIRSNLNFEIILEVKKAKNRKIAKNCIFLPFLAKDTGHRGLKFCIVPYVTSIYTFVFIGFPASCIDPII